MKIKIILAGGSGFLGCVLADYFAAKTMDVVILARKPRQGTGPTREVYWDGGLAFLYALHAPFSSWPQRRVEAVG